MSDFEKTDFRVTLEGRLTSDSGVIDADVSEALNAAMAEMHKLGTSDPAIMLTRATGEIVMSCSVKVASYEDAVPPASTDIRSGLHTGGIATPGWPGADDSRWKVEIVNARTEVLQST